MKTDPTGADRTQAVTADVAVQANYEDELTDKRRAQAEARAARAAARAALRAIPPKRDPDFRRLDLDGLRVYRAQLSDEEGRVSYWRRILQARLDTMEAGLRVRSHDIDHLKPVLTQERVGAGRTALVTILPVEDIPPLPNLEELWASDVDPSDEVAFRTLTNDLTDAERKLSDYRSALHKRINAATAELIARYHEEPTRCLSALPLDPRRR